MKYVEDRQAEETLFETRQDSILNEGLGFYRFDSGIEEDIVDPDDLDLEFSFSQDGFAFLGLGKKKSKEQKQAKKEERKERRAKRREKIRNAFDKIKDVVKDAGKALENIGEVVKKGVLAVPRASFLGLVELNYRGLAKKIYYANSDGKKKIGRSWEKLGGEPDKLFAAAANGRDRKPLVCGTRCKKKLPAVVKQGQNFDGVRHLEFLNYMQVTGAEETAVAVTTSTPIIAKITKILADVKPVTEGAAAIADDVKSIAADDRADEVENKALTPEQRQEILAAERQLLANMDPKAQIMNNTLLTDDEKKAAINALKKDGIGGGAGISSTQFWWIIGVVGAIGAGFYIWTNRNKLA